MKLTKHLEQYLLEISEKLCEEIWELEQMEKLLVNDVPNLIKIIEMMLDTCPNSVFEKISKIILKKD